MARSKAGAFTKGKGWRKSIGKKLAPDGRLLPIRFWLGMDEQKASIAALQIESLWLQQKRPYWASDALATAESIRVGLTRADAPERALVAMPSKVRARAPMTVKVAIGRYRQAMLGNPRLMDATKQCIRCRTLALETSPIASMPLDDIGAEQLSALVHHWLKRPTVERTSKPITATSARLMVQTARACFDWLDAMGLWNAPRRFTSFFRLPRDGNAPTILTIDVEDLTALYHAADERNRLLMLLALNLGFCSMECATLKRSEIDFDKGIIRRSRQKTNVVCQWKLWDETRDLLREQLAPENKQGLALLTDAGTPLVRYSANNHRTDTIVHCWSRLTTRARVAHQPFKLLRKTGATMIRSIEGIEVSEMYLAHSERSMARFYSRPDQSKLDDALMVMRSQLQPMFETSQQASQAKGEAMAMAMATATATARKAKSAA